MPQHSPNPVQNQHQPVLRMIDHTYDRHMLVNACCGGTTSFTADRWASQDRRAARIPTRHATNPTGSRQNAADRMSQQYSVPGHDPCTAHHSMPQLSSRVQMPQSCDKSTAGTCMCDTKATKCRSPAIRQTCMPSRPGPGIIQETTNAHADHLLGYQPPH